MWGWDSNSRNGDLGVHWDSRNFRVRLQGSKHRGVLYIIGKLSKCRCRKWARMSHLDICSTSYGKKKGPGVKLVVWLLTTKSQKSTRPWGVQVKCDTPLESFRRELQVCFKPHPNRRSEQKVISLQNGGSPSRDSFGTPLWESRDKKPFGCRCHGET